jgi:stage V sporulation protein SpoVS
VYGEAVTADAEGCKSAAGALARLIDDQNSIGVQILTHGLLNHVEIEMDRATVRLHLAMTRDQIDIVLAFVGGRLGVDMTPEADDASAPDPRAPRR